MTPPRSRGMHQKAIDRLLDEYDRRHVQQAIVLVNNATETEWFQKLAGAAAAMCFLQGRIAFVSADHKRVSRPTRGQAILLLCRPRARALGRFIGMMPRFGHIYGREVG